MGMRRYHPTFYDGDYSQSLGPAFARLPGKGVKGLLAEVIRVDKASF
jgi:hypothetical protein